MYMRARSGRAVQSSMSRPVLLNIIAIGCLCANCYLVLENAQSIAEGYRLRVNMRRESTRTFRGFAALAAVLYVTVFSSTLCCISDVAFLCSQCTGNHVCVRAFLLWNAFDIIVTFACDIALYYLVQSVYDQGYRALQSATETTREDTTSTLDYMQDNIMERYPSGRDHFDSDYETTTERITTRESFPRKVVAFTEKIRSKPSLPQIVLVAIFKVLVLILFKQYSDREPAAAPAGSDHESSSISHVSLSQMGAWKAAYARRRSTLHSMLGRTLDMQAQGIGEEPTPRSVDAPPCAAPGTPEGVRDGSPSSGSPRKCKGLSGNLHKHDHGKKLDEQVGGTRSTTASSTAAPDGGVRPAVKTPPATSTTVLDNRGAYCRADRDTSRWPERLGRELSTPNSGKMSSTSEEPTTSSKFFVTADETPDPAARPLEGRSVK
ncbi:uncharacterized protein [Dermacentor albipictus]|uniref:uncharacterized protein isoform X1 n=1 Tax=Dermacentor albipictus TaxID=60249 RepID=UPI0031FDFCD6